MDNISNSENIVFEKNLPITSNDEMADLILAFNKIQDISGKDFLMGFYYRYKENYLKAEEYLLKALTINPNMQVARREFVNVYLNQCE